MFSQVLSSDELVSEVSALSPYIGDLPRFVWVFSGFCAVAVLNVAAEYSSD